MDGDTVLTTDNEVLLRNYEDTLVIQCAQRSSEKVIPTEQDIIKSNILSFGTLVGTYTNYVTSWHDIQAQYSPTSEEYKETAYRIVCGQHYTQLEIDKAKGCISPPMKSYWYDWKEAIKRDEMVGGNRNRSIVADRKPYFMKYRYPKLSKEYNAYIKKANYDCSVDYGCTVDEFFDRKHMSPDEERYAKWLDQNSPVSMGHGTMNRVCKKIEKLLMSTKNKWQLQGEHFGYSIYRNPDAHYGHKEYMAVAEVVNRYKDEMEMLPRYAKTNKLSDDTVTFIRSLIAENAREECYCCNVSPSQLANIILDMTYGEHHPSSLAWDITGDIIIQNLLKRHDNVVHYYQITENGDIEYSGEHFIERSIRLEESQNTDNE